jgi:hypothetical protein
VPNVGRKSVRYEAPAVVCRITQRADDPPIDRDDERRRADEHRVFAADDDFARRAGDDFHVPFFTQQKGKRARVRRGRRRALL